jgi:O-antigen/teichoic acid export membrane protein
LFKTSGAAKEFPSRGGLAARIGTSRFARNVAVLASGTAAGQTLMALAYLILVRLYDPADFGLFAVFGALNMTILAVATWRYELAVVLARTEAEAVNLMAVALSLALVTSLLAGGILVAGGETLLGFVGAAELAPLVWLLPLASISGSTAMVFGNFGNRGRDYALLSWSQIWRSGGVAGAQVVFGLLRLGVPGLILGQIFGSLMGTLALVRQYRGRYAEMLGMVDWSEMRRLAREHADFPRYNAPSALLLSLSVSMPSILLAFFFGPAVAGLYWFAYRLLEMPITLIGRATRRVFFAEAAERHRNGRPLSRLYLLASLALAGVALPPVVVVAAFGQPLFELAFGPEWREAGLYASWMMVWWLFRFAAVPSHMLAPVLGLQKQFLILQVAGLLPRLLVIPLAAWFGTALHAVAGYSLVGVVLNILPMLVVAATLRRSKSKGAGAPAMAPGT